MLSNLIKEFDLSLEDGDYDLFNQNHQHGFTLQPNTYNLHLEKRSCGNSSSY
jgi:hypothetical protein